MGSIESTGAAGGDKPRGGFATCPGSLFGCFPELRKLKRRS